MGNQGVAHLLHRRACDAGKLVVDILMPGTDEQLNIAMFW